MSTKSDRKAYTKLSQLPKGNKPKQLPIDSDTVIEPLAVDSSIVNDDIPMGKQQWSDDSIIDLDTLTTDTHSFDLRTTVEHWRITKRNLVCSCVICLCLALSIAALIVALILSPHSNHSNADTNHCTHWDRNLLIVSLDGFRFDYLTDSEYRQTYNISTPNFDEIIESGILAPLKPVYPSKTFPNHLSIITGLYPGWHGIISNHFYDRILNKTFSKSVDRKGEFYRGRPIWQLNQFTEINSIENDPIKSGVIFWPGSSSNVSGKGYPNWFTDHYNESMADTHRVDIAIDLMLGQPTLTQKPISDRHQLVVIYFSDTDEVGHPYGPESLQVAAKIESLDETIGDLISKMEAFSLRNNTDIVIVSDHGMAQMYPDDSDYRIVINYTYLNNAYNHAFENGLFWFNSVAPTIEVYIGDDSISPRIVATIIDESIVTGRDRMQMYVKADKNTPFEYNSAYHNRVFDIIVEPLSGNVFYFDGWNETNQWWLRNHGNHGFNNSLREMTGILIGSGPNFKENSTAPRIENLHLYELFCHLLCGGSGVTPSPNNGSFHAIKHILKDF